MVGRYLMCDLRLLHELCNVSVRTFSAKVFLVQIMGISLTGVFISMQRKCSVSDLVKCC